MNRFHHLLMRSAATGAVALVLLVPAAAAQSAEPDSTRPASAGAYTDAQAEEGRSVFTGTCGNCHGTAEFSGPAFRRIWEGRRVYDFFDQLRNTMPLDNPGGLAREQYVSVIAYILELNKYPAGADPLPAKDDELRRITF